MHKNETTNDAASRSLSNSAASSHPEHQPLRAGIWQYLLAKSILYATGHISRWQWRGSVGGILPDGFDPESIAAQAIADFIQDAAHAVLPPSGCASCVHGGVREIQRDLERRVRRHVNRLHHRSENRLLRNEPDLARYTLDDGEAISVIELVPEPSLSPDAALIESESLNQFDSFRSRFAASIGKDRQMLKLFDLFSEGCSAPAEVASRLKIRRNKVKNLRRRFLRKWSQFHRPCPCPRSGKDTPRKQKLPMRRKTGTRL